MSATLTYTFKHAPVPGVFWYRCELCPIDVHAAMLTEHAKTHRRAAWRIGEQ